MVTYVYADFFIYLFIVDEVVMTSVMTSFIHFRVFGGQNVEKELLRAFISDILRQNSGFFQHPLWMNL